MAIAARPRVTYKTLPGWYVAWQRLRNAFVRAYPFDERAASRPWPAFWLREAYAYTLHETRFPAAVSRAGGPTPRIALRRMSKLSRMMEMGANTAYEIIDAAHGIPAKIQGLIYRKLLPKVRTDDPFKLMIRRLREHFQHKTLRRSLVRIFVCNFPHYPPY